MGKPNIVFEPRTGAERLGRLRARLKDVDATLRKLSISVVCGGDTAEREISLISGRGILGALIAEGMQAQLVDWRPGQPVEAIPGDVAFLALHGGAGEDGHVQAALEMAGKIYVSCGVLTSAIGMHKPTFKRIVQGMGLLTPRWAVVTPDDDTEQALAPLPECDAYFIKPISEGSSVGVRSAKRDELRAAVDETSAKYGAVLVEERITGREVTASVLGLPGSPIVLPHVEIAPVSAEFYDYKAKYTKGETNYIIPARLSDDEDLRLAQITAALHGALILSPYARIDAIISGGEPYFLEINTLPGFTPLSLVPQAAKASGIEYGELLRILIYLALEIHQK
jgi:D-alanine-D-alanine ligase